MTSARERVFSTPELLEAILVQLHPINHLLGAQLISRTFHTTINSSPTIQQLLFFRPTTTKEWTVNPLLRQHFLPWFVIPDKRSGGLRNYDTLRLMDWTTSNRAAFLRKEASWRKMLLMQPSPRELNLVRWVHGQIGDSEEVARVAFDDTPSGSVTMGLIYDLTELFLRRQHTSFPSFGLAFKDSDTGPQVTLYHSMTMQCCRSAPPAGLDLASEGVDASDVVKWERSMVNGAGRFGRLNMVWTTDLTEERGGVEKWEWEEWKRKRVPISDLGSDVR